MASFQPFQPALKNGVAGLTVSLQPTTTSQVTQVISGNAENPSILVQADGPTVGVVYMRMSLEASSTITATATDTPIILGPNPTVRLFANPSPTGTVNIAVIMTASPSVTPATLWFTPGEGGCL